MPQLVRQERMTWSPTLRVRHALADAFDDAGALVAQDDGEDLRAPFALEDVPVAVTDAGRHEAARGPRAAPAKPGLLPRR